MELNSSMMSNNNSISTSTQSSIISSTATVIYNDRLFLHTITCQAIAGAFTWAAILITSYHVKDKQMTNLFFLIFENLDLSSLTSL